MMETWCSHIPYIYLVRLGMFQAWLFYVYFNYGDKIKDGRQIGKFSVKIQEQITRLMSRIDVFLYFVNFFKNKH